MQSAGNAHEQIGDALLRVAEHLLDVALPHTMVFLFRDDSTRSPFLLLLSPSFLALASA